MKVHHYLQSYPSLKTLSLMLFSMLGSANAASLNLATAPLLITTGIEPNIQLILDDSGSMDWEVMIQEGKTTLNLDQGVGKIGLGDFYRVRPEIHPGFAKDSNVIPPIVSSKLSYPEAWVTKNPDANPLYYDTNVTYKPWPGTKADGTAMFSDANPNKIYENPSEIGAASVHDNVGQHVEGTIYSIDLERDYPFYDNSIGNGGGQSYYYAVFYTWDDDDGVDSNGDGANNGVVDTNDSHTLVEIKPATSTALYGKSRNYTEEMQNFANWFQYYRKRGYLAKAALGNMIVNASESRMGLFLISSIFSYDVASMTTKANRIALLTALYSADLNVGSTPLRSALNEVGRMYAGKHGSKTTPILSVADGGTCQQNFQILMTDGFWNGDDVSIRNGDGVDMGNEDGGTSNSDFDGSYYADAYSGTLADVAMYYYENDLQPTYADEVPTVEGVDEAEHQHLVTYTIAFGVKGDLDSSQDPTKVTVNWTEPQKNKSSTIDDLWHAGFNGRGKFLSASNIDELTKSLKDIVTNIAERTATASAVAINSAQLTTDTVIYLAEFNTFRWQGEILAYKIANTTTGALSDDPKWQAGQVLTARKLLSSPRTIITYDNTASGREGIPFRWSDLTASQKNDLKVNSSGGVDADSIGEARLKYLRGERKNEGDGLLFRERSSLLGDVVNSGPVYVGAPSLTWPDTAPFPTGDSSKYSAFAASKESRPGVVYVAANDGMLHAFAESDGEELFAYIPSMIFSTETDKGLHYLTHTDYVHQFYNDLTPSISDIYVDLGDGDEWVSILIGGLRGGGRGIYALNVNDPDDFSESNAEDMVLWEFTSTDDDDLGYTYSEPQIALANNGKWVAILGNGYNNTGDGEAKLFILDIEAGVDGKWSATDYIEITTDSGDDDDINGLSTPVLADIDGDGDVDRVYAGDLKGQLWVFDLSSGTSSSWALANEEPLFTTIGNRPITAQPEISTHPTENTDASNSPNIMVFFGSGQYLATSDINATTTNHFYGIWDTGNAAVAAEDVGTDQGHFDLTSLNLVEQTFDANYSDRVLTQNAVDYGNKKGWYFALDQSGERSVSSAVSRFDVVFFNTFIPSSNSCSNGGLGYKFAVSAATGGALEAVTFDTNDDGVIDESDKSTYESVTKTIAAIAQTGYLPEPVFVQGISYTADIPTVVKNEGYLETGRLSWQELLR